MPTTTPACARWRLMKPRSMTAPRDQAKISKSSLVALCLGLGLIAMPLWGQTAAWQVAALFGAIIFRLLCCFSGWPLPSQAFKLCLLAAGIGLGVLTHGALAGMEGALG